MKTLREFVAEARLSEHTWCSIKVDGESIHILILGTLKEARYRGVPVGGEYSVRLHKAHSPVGKDHIHTYKRNNQLFALNIDGSAHDQSHGVQIPNRLVKGIKQHFPSIVLPNDNLIEWAPEGFVKEIVTRRILYG